MANRGSFGYDSGGGSYGSYHAGAPPSGASRDSTNEYTRLTQSVSNNIQKITQNVSQIQKFVSQIGTQQDSSQLRDRLHQVQHYTNQLAKDTKIFLTDLSHLPAPGSTSEQRQRKMQKERLMNDFTKVLNNFQSEQRKAAEKEKESMARVRASSSSAMDPFDEKRGGDNLVNFDGYGVASHQNETSNQQVLQVEEDVDLSLMREREQAIHQLESDIMDVNQIFKDLGMLVHEQGEVIDSIEANVETAAVHVEDGADQLRQARDYQSSARRKKCIILIIVLVVLGIIATIIGVTVSKK